MKTASLIFTTYSMTRALSNRKSIYDFLAGFYLLFNAIETLFPSVTVDLTTIQGDLGVEITLKHDAQHIPNEVIQELRAMFQRVALAVIHRRRQVSEIYRSHLRFSLRSLA